MKKLIIISLLALAACTDISPAPAEEMPSPTYFKDERVDICYAAVTSVTYAGYVVASITDVPCEKVQGYLQPTK